MPGAENVLRDSVIIVDEVTKQVQWDDDHPDYIAVKKAAAKAGVTIDSKGVITGMAAGKKKFGRLVGRLQDVGKVFGEGDPSSPDFVGPPAPKPEVPKGMKLIGKRKQFKRGGKVKSDGGRMKRAKVLSRGQKR